MSVPIIGDLTTVVVFTELTTPDFAAFEERLTDSASETMFNLIDLFIDESVHPIGGSGGGGNPDLFMFPNAMFWDVAFVRLNVVSLGLGPGQCAACQEGPGFHFQPNVT